MSFKQHEYQRLPFVPGYEYQRLPFVPGYVLKKVTSMVDEPCPPVAYGSKLCSCIFFILQLP